MLDSLAHHVNPGSLAGGQQCLQQSPVVDLMVTSNQNASPRRGGQGRFELSAFPAAQAFDLEPEVLLEVKEVVQRGIVVGVARNDERSGLYVAAIASRRVVQLLGPCWIARVRVEIQLKQSFLAVVHLGHRSEHPRRSPRRAAGRLIVCNHHRQAVGGCLPRDRQPDHAAACDDYIRCGHVNPSLPTPA